MKLSLSAWFGFSARDWHGRDVTVYPGADLISVNCISTPPSSQKRSTVLGRYILVVPYLISSTLLGLAAFFVLVPCWINLFANGRIPYFAKWYLSRWLQRRAEVAAYFLLMTSEYPPFFLGKRPYPVVAAAQIRPPKRADMLVPTVMFIPIAVIGSLIGLSAQLFFLLTAWPVVIVKGRMSMPMFEASRAMLILRIRLLDYFLRSDRYAQATAGDVAVTSRRYTEDPSEGSQPSPQLLSVMARQIFNRYVVFGLISALACSYLVIRYLSYEPSSIVALAKSRAAYVKLVRTQQAIAMRARNCRNSRDHLTCYISIDSGVVESYNAFAKTILSISMPAGDPVVAARQLAEAAIQTGEAFQSSDRAHGLLQYEALVAGAPTKVDIIQVQNDYGYLRYTLQKASAGHR